MSVDLRLEYQGGGKFQTITKRDFETAEGEYAVGERVVSKTHRQRSVSQNNLFHALIEAAFDNQRAGPTFANWRQLKGWLLVEAEHSETDEVSLIDPDRKRPLSLRHASFIVSGFATSIRRRLGVEYVRITYRPNRAVALLTYPKSWKFHDTDGDTAGDVMNRVVEIITQVIMPGSTVEEIMDEARSRAGMMKQPRKEAA